MGRNLLWRKTLIFSLMFSVLGNTYSFGEQDRIPEQSAVISTVEIRSAQRTLQPPIGVDLSEIRQSHAGPEVLSSLLPLHPEVEANFQRILNSSEDKARILRAMERSKPYISFIQQKIQEYNLPPEIFFLPVVESLYNPYARSPQGAVGIWQFMPDSMHPWMIRNEWMDERRDFWKSTIGALEKLQINYRYTGDWLLALAAYNCGLNRVLTTMRAHPGKDFWALSRERLLPRETRAYIPRFLAVAQYASYLGRRGHPLDWEPTIQWATIPLSFPIDLRVLARKAEIPLDELLLGNRELQFPITPPSTYKLKVPEPYKEKVSALLKQEKNSLVDFVVHTVNPGDTLYDLSHHFGAPLSMIQNYNPGVRPETLQIGKKLLIPRLRDVGPYIPKSSAKEDPDDSGPFINTYTVQAGDNLWNIARNFRTSVKRLIRENGISEDTMIHPGDTLKVP